MTISEKNKADMNRLKSIIKELGQTQIEFAENIGRDEKYISKIISGKRPMTQGVAEQIKKKYGYEIDYIFGKTEISKDAATTILEDFQGIFSEISVTTQGYMNDKREEVENKFLTLSMDEYLYQFLMDFDHIEFRKENHDIDNKAYDTELELAKKDYLNRKGTGEVRQYILIPTIEMPYIVATDRQHKKAWGEVQKVLDWDYQVNSSPVNMFKLARSLDEQPTATRSREEIEENQSHINKNQKPPISSQGEQPNE